MNGKVEKIVVTINGKQFSRRTPRAYRFAIIGRSDEAVRSAQVREYCARVWGSEVGAAKAEDWIAGLKKGGAFDLHVLGWTQVDTSTMFAKFQKATSWGGYVDLAIVPVGGVFPALEG